MRKLSVLIVDEDVNVSILSRVMSDLYEDLDMEQAHSLAEARVKLWAKKYDVIIYDLWIGPDVSAVPYSDTDDGLLSGYHLSELVISDKQCINKGTPYLFLTGLSPREHSRIKELSTKLTDRFFSKPVRPRFLHDAIVNLAHPAN
jgi:hypothetical protein